MLTNSPFPTGAQVVAYLRDSGGEDQDLSVPQQAASIAAWAIDHGLILLNLYKDEAAPGSSTIGREAFQQMIHWFRSPGCPAAGMVIWKYSRFARDIDDSMFYKADLRRRGFIVHSLNDSIPEGINGRFFEAAVDWMNQRFLEDLSIDVKRGLAHLVQTYGAIPGTPPRGFQREPFELGLRRDGSPHIVHKWVPDPETWQACRTAWRMRSLNATYRQIQAATHLFGSLNSYADFFSNPIYRGELHYGDMVIPDAFERLVDDATWSKVQALAARNARHSPLSGPDNPDHPRRKASRFLLSGIARCARCGSPLNGHAIKFKNNPKSFDYYACSLAQRRHECDARQIPRHVLEETVVNTLVDFLQHPDVILDHQRQQATVQDQERELITSEKAEIKRRLSALERKIINLTDTIADQGLAARHLVIKLQALEAQETELLTELAHAEKTDLEPLTHFNPAQLSALADRVQDLYKKGDQDNLHLVFSGIIAKLVAERDANLVRGLIQFYLPPNDPPSEDPVASAPTKGKLFMPMKGVSLGAPIHRHKFTIPFSSPIK